MARLIIRVFEYSIIDSTNKEAIRLLKSYKAPFAVFANEQNFGCGQYGRTWFSPRGNLYLSIVWDTKSISKKFYSSISLRLALILCDYIKKKFNLELKIKWPNDILYCDKKIGGILSESAFCGSDIQYIVSGLGLNFVKSPNNFRSDKLNSYLQEPICSRDFMEDFLNFLEAQDLNKVNLLQSNKFFAPYSQLLVESRTNNLFLGNKILEDGSLQIKSLLGGGLESVYTAVDYVSYFYNTFDRQLILLSNKLKKIFIFDNIWKKNLLFKVDLRNLSSLPKNEDVYCPIFSNEDSSLVALLQNNSKILFFENEGFYVEK